MLVFATFAVGFVVRPIGGFVFDVRSGELAEVEPPPAKPEGESS